MMRKRRAYQNPGQQKLFSSTNKVAEPYVIRVGGTDQKSSMGSIHLSQLLRNRSLTEHLLAEVLSIPNLNRAYDRVLSNGGTAGIDGMRVEDLVGWLSTHLESLRVSLENGSYQPSAVLRVEIPKSSGGVRRLGIPTVLDRFIQEAIHQQLSKYYDPLFSESSYGYRPGRSAHQAVLAASEHVKSGYCWVVNIDLANYFDSINQDRLMQRLGKGVGDKRLLRLIKR